MILNTRNTKMARRTYIAPSQTATDFYNPVTGERITVVTTTSHNDNYYGHHSRHGNQTGQKQRPNYENSHNHSQHHGGQYNQSNQGYGNRQQQRNHNQNYSQCVYGIPNCYGLASNSGNPCNRCRNNGYSGTHTTNSSRRTVNGVPQLSPAELMNQLHGLTDAGHRNNCGW